MNLKKYLSISYATIAEKIGPNNKIILHTSNGTILGIPIFSDQELSDTFDQEKIHEGMTILTHNLIDAYKKDNYKNQEDKLSDEDSVLLLKDVTIIGNGNRYNSPFLVLFVNEIIGLSIGNI